MTEVKISSPRCVSDVPEPEAQRVIVRALSNAIRDNGLNPLKPRAAMTRLHRMGFSAREIDRHYDDACAMLKSERD